MSGAHLDRRRFLRLFISGRRLPCSDAQPSQGALQTRDSGLPGAVDAALPADDDSPTLASSAAAVDAEIGAAAGHSFAVLRWVLPPRDFEQYREPVTPPPPFRPPRPGAGSCFAGFKWGDVEATTRARKGLKHREGIDLDLLHRSMLSY